MRYITLAAALVAFPIAASAQPKCGPRDVVLPGFAAKFGEAPAMHGVSSQGHVFELLLSDDGASWTLLVTLPNGMSCLAAEGSAWTMAPFAPSAPPGNPS